MKEASNIWLQYSEGGVSAAEVSQFKIFKKFKLWNFSIQDIQKLSKNWYLQT